MYVPKPFEVNDPAWAQDLMRRESFALLVTADENGSPVATHLPLHLESRGPHGTLVGHVARANPQWRQFDGRREALVMFWGPHAYVSPAWYPNQPAVPTWNYVTVHAYGVPRVIEDAARIKAGLAALAAVYESGRPQRWRFESLSDDYVAGMIKGIVAFEMEIARIEAKAKLSQNRTPADRAGVIAGLETAGDPGSLDMARLMRAVS